MRKDIKEVFQNFKIRSSALEMCDAAQVKYLVSHHHAEVIVYTDADFDIVAVHFLRDVIAIEPSYVIEYAPVSKNLEGIPVVSAREFAMTAPVQRNLCVFVATQEFSDDEKKSKLLHYFENLNARVITDVMLPLKTTIKPHFFHYLLEHQDEFVKQYSLFTDEISQETYCQYVAALLTGNTYIGPEYSESDKYFGTENNSRLYTETYETWINCGSCRGDNIFYFLDKDLKFKKIYAIEGSRERFQVLSSNLAVLPKDVQAKIQKCNVFLGNSEFEVTIDQLVGDEKITLINMDVEGDEEIVLISARQVIRRDAPVLAVCAYHKPDDLLRLPRVISNLRSDYHFILRKYPSSSGFYYNGVYRTNELVLYAVPSSRMIQL